LRSKPFLLHCWRSSFHRSTRLERALHLLFFIFGTVGKARP
jgi:hypothetical protein